LVSTKEQILTRKTLLQALLDILVDDSLNAAIYGPEILQTVSDALTLILGRTKVREIVEKERERRKHAKKNVQMTPTMSQPAAGAKGQGHDPHAVVIPELCHSFSHTDTLPGRV
jgi:hypothetical protein